MLRCMILGAICLIAGNALAQSSSDSPATSSPAPAPAKPVTAMEEPLPGDFWTYEIRDEITGKVTSIRTFVITEATPTEISVSVRVAGKDDIALSVYDRSWNLKNAAPWKYEPHDGSGIRSPLEIGKTWPVKTNNINSANGNVWKRSGTSKVIGQESVTTKAGVFDTFKIETTFTATNINNPTFKNEVTSLTWYAPAIDHWVRRTFVSRTNNHLRINNTIELVEYGRKN
jgi:hypothetical protein